MKQIEQFGDYYVNNNSAMWTIQKQEAQQHVDKIYLSLEEFQDYSSFSITNTQDEFSAYFLPVPAKSSLKCNMKNKPIGLNETVTFNTEDYDMTNTYIVYNKYSDDIFFYSHRKTLPKYNMWLLFLFLTMGTLYLAHTYEWLTILNCFKK